jgi:hypothetical protein
MNLQVAEKLSEPRVGVVAAVCDVCDRRNPTEPALTERRYNEFFGNLLA